MLEYIDRLKKEGLFQEGLKLGIIPSHIAGWYEIYLKYQALRIQGHKKSDAVLYAALECNISQDVVWKILRRFEKKSDEITGVK